MSDLRKKCVFLVLDGLGDLPHSALAGRTPLEAAETPVMNRLAGSGWCGLVDPIGPGKIPNTHSGCGAVFGVLPGQSSRLKRGPVEAAGAGRILRAGEIAVRANFATLESRNGELAVLDRRAGRITQGTAELGAVLRNVDLGNGITAQLQPTDQHRCVLVLSGPGLDPRISDTDPGDRAVSALVKACKPLDAAATITAEKVNLFIEAAHRLLAGQELNQQRVAAGLLPANGIITRGAGAGFTPHSVVSERGFNAAVVAGCNTVIGLSRTLGFHTIIDARFTADAHTDLPAKMEAALSALEDYDLVYVHIKAPDLFSHDHQPKGKRDFLSRFDDALAALEITGSMIAVAADHSTDCNSGAHTADPVPALIYAPLQGDRISQATLNFGETACRQGNMPRQSSHDLLLRLLALMAAG